jgi:hypothetical protein
MVHLNGLKERNMKDNGKIICTMEWVYLSGQMENAIEASTKIIRKVVKVPCPGPMENAKQDHGAMESSYRHKLIEFTIGKSILTRINQPRCFYQNEC